MLQLGIVHHGDCLERLYELEPGSVSLVFADLPYGVTANRWDKPLDLSRLWPALRRVCRPTAAMVFTATQPFASDHARGKAAWQETERRANRVAFALA